MKLAEALLYRADAQRKVSQLQQRLNRVVKVQEGDKPGEDPQLLLDELKSTTVELTKWIQLINRTNAQTSFNNDWLIADALIERDRIMSYRTALSNLLEEASIKQDRYSHSEIRFQSTINVKQLQTEIDYLSKQYREIDIKIQELNWTTDLVQ